MKNRFCRMGKSLLSAMCLLSTCGVTYSCSDDFDLDETKPSFLGASIYNELNARGNFSNVVKLIDDLGYKDVMQQTGSKTLFVADDDAYKKFFETCTWKKADGVTPVRTYADLSTGQKRLLLNGSMLNNAYVMEMLTTIQGPLKNLCLRQLSSASATDSIRIWQPSELPFNENDPNLVEEGNMTDTHYWANYNTERGAGKPMVMAIDKTAPMLTHFLEGQMNEKNITPDDVAFVLNIGDSKVTNPDGSESTVSGADQVQGKAFVYNRLVKEQDVTCLNGYFHVLDGVLETPQNMAEVIRTNGSTNFFSALLDRFSLPLYDATLTKEYNALHTENQVDSVYEKVYISQRSQRGVISSDINGNSLGDFPALAYDPGWNQYSVNLSTKEQDMGAMFVPSDKAMLEYFLKGAGLPLLERYVKNEAQLNKAKAWVATQSLTPEIEAAFRYCLFQIPLNIVRPLVANLMKDSFNETVPSKYLTIMNDAQDQMFLQYDQLSDYKNAFEKRLMANNGVVYVMNTVIAPATYASVMAPALYTGKTNVMNTVIHADEQKTETDFANAPLRKFYHTYLLAMQSRFTLFVPTDEGLKNFGYIDPVSSITGATAQKYYWTFTPEAVTTNAGKRIAVRAEAFRYTEKNALQGQQTRPLKTSNANDDVTLAPKSANFGAAKASMLCEIMDQHIIVHDNDDVKGIKGDANYYISRSGAPVKVLDKKGSNLDDMVGIEVVGGKQIELNTDDLGTENDFTCKVTDGYDMTGGMVNGVKGYGNGRTYFLDRPMQPSAKNVYHVLKNTESFTKFFDLCYSFDQNAPLIQTLFRDDMTTSEWNVESAKYRIFNEQGSKYTTKGEALVRFFSSYRYSIFVPTNEQIDQAIADGLPTLPEIQEAFDAVNGDANATAEEKAAAKAEAQAKVTCLLSFLKYHFCDLSYFVDNVNKAAESTSTACAQNTENGGGFTRLTIKQTPDAMALTDAAGSHVNVVASDKSKENITYNVLARDFEFNLDGASPAYANARYITSSSYVVLHQIDNYLVFQNGLRGNFSKAWATPAAAKAFVKKFEPKK